MIYITGDTHSDLYRFNNRTFPEQKEMTRKDTVIILGDFGGIWYQKDNKSAIISENHKLDELENRNFTTVFIPGNHENYDRLFSDEFPTKEWNGGLVKEIRPHILMLMRGEYYTIEGKTFFAMGGASSHDIRDGILDNEDPRLKTKIKSLKRKGRYMYRINHISWWTEEIPSEEEKKHAIETLDKHNWACDYVLTHEAPASVIPLIDLMYRADNFAKWLETIRQKLTYKHWFFGHYHDNKNINPETHLLYEQIVRIV